jgi:hypothetical protein
MANDGARSRANAFAFVVGFLLVLSFCVWRIWLGDDAFVRVHDNLDSSIIYMSIAHADPQGANPQARDLRLMNGAVSPSPLVGAFSVNTVLYRLFKPSTAYLVNELLVRLLGFIGAFLLSRLVAKKVSGVLDAAFALVWSLSPIITFFGLSVAGQPLLLWAFLSLMGDRKDGKALLPFAVVAIYPFWSDLILAGVFEHAVIAACFVYFFVADRPRAWKLLPVWAVFIVCSCISNLDLIQKFLGGGFTASHRAEFDVESISTSTAIHRVSRLLSGGHSHVMMGKNVILLYGVVGLVAATILRIGGKANRRVGFGWILLSSIALVGLVYGFYDWKKLEFLQQGIPILRLFQFDRFYFLLPLACFLLAFLVADLFAGSSRPLRLASSLLLAAALAGHFMEFSKKNDEIFTTLTRPPLQTSNIGAYPRMTMAQYLSPELFAKIKEKIGLPLYEYRTLSLGLAPVIAYGNGMYCLDAYIADYPLSYKTAFRKVIGAELEANERWKKYFDRWGSRCYLFSSELKGFYYGKGDARSISKVRISGDALKSIYSGPVFVISAVEVQDPAASNLRLIEVFESEESPWRIHLYSIGT